MGLSRHRVRTRTDRRSTDHRSFVHCFQPFQFYSTIPPSLPPSSLHYFLPTIERRTVGGRWSSSSSSHAATFPSLSLTSVARPTEEERERERETEWTAWFLCRRCSRRRRTEAAEQLPWNEALKKVTDRATVVRSEADEGRGRGNEFVAQHVDFKCRQGKLDLTLASVVT